MVSDENRNLNIIFSIIGNIPRSVNNLNGGTFSNIIIFNGIGIINGIIGIGMKMTNGTNILIIIQNTKIQNNNDNIYNIYNVDINNRNIINKAIRSEPKNWKSNNTPNIPMELKQICMNK